MQSSVSHTPCCHVKTKATATERMIFRKSQNLTCNPFLYLKNSPNPPYRFMLCRSHPLRGANPQRFLIPCICTPPGLAASGGIYTRAPIRGSALMCKVPAMRNCVSNGVRTSRCRTVFSMSPSKRPRTSPLSKSVCNRVCALSLWAVHRCCFRCVRLSIAFPAPGFHRWERPSFHQQQDLNLQLNPQLCCHEARLYQLSYVGI